MKASRFLKAVCVVGIASACAFAVSACSGTNGQAAESDVAGLTGGVAATVNGVEIEEDSVTKYLQSYREAYSLADMDTWGQWLIDNDYTPEALREDIIDYYAGQELIKQAAQENDIEVPSTEIDEYVDKMKAYYETDEKWQEALAGANTSEEEYRQSIEIALLEKKVQEVVAVAEEPTDEEMLEYAQMYATSYNGAKRSSHILFESTDETTAQEVLDKINAGELDFTEAAKEYSADGSASSGGDVGWDKLSSFVTAYTTALATLENNQVSGLVTSEYGIHIIKCTDVFVAPEEVTDISQIPTEFTDTIRSSLESSKQSEAFNAWYAEYKEAADIVINPMPENVPYNVDLSNFQKTESTSSTDDSATGDSATDASSDTSQ